MSLAIETVGGYCPCQAEGTMDGNPFYFRARHGDWWLHVTAPGVDPVDACIGRATEIHTANGDDPDEGYMEPAEATKIITEHYAKWFGQPKKGATG